MLPDETNSTVHRMSITQVIEQSVLITLIPAGVMLLAGLLTLFFPMPPSKNVAHAIQHLAAGVLLSAIALELIPPIAKAEEKMSIVGMVVGFSLGAIVMISLPLILDDEEEEKKSDIEMGDHSNEGSNLMQQPGHSEADFRMSDDEISPAHHTNEPQRSPRLTPNEVHVVQQHNETSLEGIAVQPSSPTSKVPSTIQRMFLRRLVALKRLFQCQVKEEKSVDTETDLGRKETRFPLVFATAVFVDSFMDGLLVGISLVSGASAGVFMAVAMASEMGFLGLSFAASVVPMPKIIAIPAVVGGPFFMVVGAVVGGSIADALSVNEPLLVGCTSFGVAALLYMVTEELLVSAHEDGFGHRWWVDIQVFVGFLIAMVIAKLIEA